CSEYRQPSPYGFHCVATCTRAPVTMPPRAALWINETRPYVGALSAMSAPVVRPTAIPGRLATNAALSWSPVPAQQTPVPGQGFSAGGKGVWWRVLICFHRSPSAAPSPAPSHIEPMMNSARLSGMYLGTNGVATSTPPTTPTMPPRVVRPTDATSGL